MPRAATRVVRLKCSRRSSLMDIFAFSLPWRSPWDSKRFSWGRCWYFL